MRPHTPWLALDASTSKVVELGASRLLFGTLGSVVSGQGFVGGDQWPHAGGGYLGDNMAAISIIQNPDGPWRTRHLRLRASVLKERLQEGSWRIFHLDGKRLIADVFTKAIVDKNVWSWFRRFVHFQAPEGGTRETEVVAEVTEVVTEAKSKAKMVCLLYTSPSPRDA